MENFLTEAVPNITCSFHDLIHTPQTIDFLCNTAAKSLCSDHQDVINFFEFYWCDINGNLPLLLVIYILAIFFIFKYTAIAVDEYVADGISKISDWLGFSESLAAVTLLALANGAGDVITALVASDAEGGVSYNIGALYGAGLFVCSMVVAICIFKSEETIVYDKMIIYRDIGIYLISTFATAGFALYGYITWWSSCILLFLYVLLVLVVVITEQVEKARAKKNGKNERKKSGHSERNDTLLTMGDNPLGKPLNDDDDDDGVKVEDDGETDVKEEDDDKKRKSRNLKEAFKTAARIVGKEKLRESRIKTGGFEEVVEDVRLAALKNFLHKKLELIKAEKEKPISEKSVLGKINHILDIPAEYILYLTALPVSEEQYSKLRCLIYSIPGILFTWWIFHPEIDMTFVYYALPVGVLLFIIFLVALPKDKPPKWSMFLTIMGVASGLMWTKVLVGILIDMLNTLGVILNLPEAYLGLTILAIGNALPDALTTVALCQQGAGTMAISGGYAGQLFGYLVGFGVSMLKLTLKDGEQKFNLFDFSEIQDNLLSLVVIGVAFLVLAITFIYGILNKFRMKRGFAWVILGLYVLFIIGSSVFAINQAITKP